MALFRFKALNLRTYLLLLLLPLAVLPPLILGVASIFWIERALEENLKSRTGPEILGIRGVFEKIERRLGIYLDSVYRDQTQFSLNRFQNLKSNSRNSIFSEIALYSKSGDLKGYLNNEKQQSAWSEQIDIWKKIIPRGLSRTAGREPSSLEGDLDFLNPESRIVGAKSPVKGKRLTEDFRKSLIRAGYGSWVVFTTRPNPEIHLARYLGNSSGKNAPFILARVKLDTEVLDLIGETLGKDFVLSDEKFKNITGPSQAQIAMFKQAARSESFDSKIQSVSLWNGYGKFDTEILWFPLKVEFSENPVIVGLNLGGTGIHLLRNWIQWGLLVFISTVLLATLLLVIHVSKILTRPIKELIGATERLKFNLPRTFLESSNFVNEYRTLIEQFNQMADTVEDSQNKLKEKISDLAKANKTLQETQGQLVQSAKMSSMGQLVAGVAHELNNPIAFIYSNMSQLAEYSNKLIKFDELTSEVIRMGDPKVSQQFFKLRKDLDVEFLLKDTVDISNACLEGSRRVKEIVLGLRTFSRADSGRTGLVNLKSVAENTIKLLGKKSSLVELKTRIDPDAVIEGNDSQLGQVIMNLLVNAYQACDKRTGRIELEIQNKLNSSSERIVTIEVSDNGPGIPDDVLPKIFDPFFSTKKVGEGTGLGLSIVYGIVEKHRGRIRVETRTQISNGPLTGTRFICEFPFAEKSEQKKAS